MQVSHPGFLVSARIKFLSFEQYGVHPASKPIRTVGHFTKVKRPGHEANHLRPFRVEIKIIILYHIIII
jgi:hypothetical protein